MFFVRTKKSKKRNNTNRYFLCKEAEDDVCSVCQKGVVSKSLLYNIGLTLIKSVIGFMTGSKVLVADAVQSFMDSTTFGAHYSGARPTKGSPSMPLLIIGAIMFLSGVWICSNSLSIIISHIPSRPGLFALVVIWTSILINGHLYMVSACIQRYSPDYKNNILCLVQNQTNFVSSCFAFLGTLLAVFGFVYFDPLAAILVGCFQIYSSLQILRESFDEEVWDETSIKRRLSLTLGVLTCCIMLFFTVNVFNEFDRRNVLLVPLEGNVLESPVSNILGRAPYFCVVDLRDNTMNIYSNQGRYSVDEGDVFLSKFVKSKNVGVVLACHIGPDVFSSLRTLGVRCYYIDLPKTVGSAITAYQEGRSRLATSANVAKKFGRSRIGWLRPWE